MQIKIGVCIKQVPAKDAALRIDWDRAWIREVDSNFESNEADIYALEEALRLKDDHGGEVIAISVGPDRVNRVLKEALAKGADRAIHILDDRYFKREPLHLAASIATAVRPEDFDLIFTGLQSDDIGFSQTGVAIAELLRLPHASIIVEIQLKDGRLDVKRELEAGWSQWVELPLPAVVTVQSGINKPRYANMKGIMAAKKKEIRRLNIEDVLHKELPVSLETVKLSQPETAKSTQFLKADGPDDIADQLAEQLLQIVKRIK